MRSLALEALRKVQRYGVGLSGEQYTGWKALPSGSNGALTKEAAEAFIKANGDNVAEIGEAYRRAMRNLHPDRNGGEESHFKRLQEAKDVLGL